MIYTQPYDSYPTYQPYDYPMISTQPSYPMIHTQPYDSYPFLVFLVQRKHPPSLIYLWVSALRQTFTLDGTNKTHHTNVRGRASTIFPGLARGSNVLDLCLSLNDTMPPTVVHDNLITSNVRKILVAVLFNSYRTCINFMYSALIDSENSILSFTNCYVWDQRR